jgi:adenosylhomocysteine nucleosidase
VTRIATCCLLLLLGVPHAVLAQPAPEPRPLLVQGAMGIEVERLASRLEHPTVEQIGGWMFWRGTIDGYTVIVSKTLKGGANAAAATALAIEHFHPLAIINQGTAGGHDAQLQLFDIVLGTSAVSLSAFRAPYRAAGAGTNPLAWRPINLNASDGTASIGPPSIGRFPGDPTLLDVARSVTRTYTRGHVVDGVIGTSDLWIDEVDLIARFHNDFGTSVEEMETASAAQIAGIFHVPFLGIRVVSDNVTNGATYNPKTSEACEDYVYDVVKAYIAKLTPPPAARPAPR